MPETFPRMTIKDVCPRPQAHPCASAAVIVWAVQVFGWKQQFAAGAKFLQYCACQVCRVQPRGSTTRTPTKLRENLGRVVVRSLFAHHPGHEVFKDVVYRFDMVTARLQIRDSAFPPK